MGFLFSRPQPPSFDPAKDLPDLTGKVFIVTGGTSGIGFATVQHLVRHGAKVYIGARSDVRAKAAIERLHAAGLGPGNGQLDWLELDMSDPRKVKANAQAFIDKEKRLDVLVNNAGVMREPYHINRDGVLESLVINYVSPFVLTSALLPLLTQTAKGPDSDVRVVFVSSETIGMLKGREVHYRNLEDLNEKFGANPMSSIHRYAKGKLANVLFAKQLQRKFDAENTAITVMALHPGGVYSEGIQKDPSVQWPIIGPIVKFYLSKTFVSSTVGAYCSVFAGASPKVKAERDKYKGAFLWPFDGKIVDPPAPQAESKELAEELWTGTEALLKQLDI